MRQCMLGRVRPLRPSMMGVIDDTGFLNSIRHLQALPSMHVGCMNLRLIPGHV
jgi:hypothetical protein